MTYVHALLSSDHNKEILKALLGALCSEVKYGWWLKEDKKSQCAH